MSFCLKFFSKAEGLQSEHCWGKRSEVRTPKRQPCLRREPIGNPRNYEQAVKQNPLLCAEFHELIHLHHPVVRIRSDILPITPLFYFRKLFQFACPIHCWTSHGSSSKRLPIQHSTYPTFLRETHDVANKFPLLRSANFSPCFHVTCLNHFSHALIPDMHNFVPWILPANPTWSSNHASDHTSKVDIKFVYVGTMDAPGPSSKTSNWCHDAIEEFQFVSDGHIAARKNQLVGKESAIFGLHMIVNIQSCTF